MMRNLIFILGDQLSGDMSSLQDADPENDTILMCEVRDETNYVRHHKKKIAFVFAAMRHFAAELEEKGFSVRYIKLTDPENSQSFSGELNRAAQDLSPEQIVITEPGEWRVLKSLNGWANQSDIPVDIRPDDRFICQINEFITWAEGRKSLRMENFYREMRKKTGLLMKDGQPEGDRWNFDAENRKGFGKSRPPLPVARSYAPDASSSARLAVA